MIDPRKIFGRLGNSLFQYATLYALAREMGVDFYFQDPKYFSNYEGEIKKLFGDGIIPNSYVSVHVRCGVNPINPNEPPYNSNPFYVNLTRLEDGESFPSYYKKAMDMFPNREFLVFTDNPPFTKKMFDNLEGYKFKIIEGQGAIEDLNMMAGCESNIISNSSFSWWGAYLNPNPNKTVIAPSRWYSDGVERTKIPDSWIKI